MSAVRAKVDAAGGHMLMESELGRGSRIELVFPDPG